MITVTDAKNQIAKHVLALAPRQMSLAQAGGKVLATAVYATVDVPNFPQSAMDGYAFALESLQPGRSLKIRGELQAGAEQELSVGRAEAIRIFTGAPLPKGGDTVVMQEKTRVDHGDLWVEDEDLQPGSNVRPAGSEIQMGELALPAGALLTPAAIGLLAGIGRDQVRVYPQPRISIIVTGRELQQPGQVLQFGQVYESNSVTLTAALQAAGFHDLHISTADDHLEQLSKILKDRLAVSDMVLLTGGVSVGDYDFALQAATASGVDQVFYKVKQRPGKPLFFGTKGEKVVFGLPGNPASVLTCFYQYVLVALEKLTRRPLQLKMQEAVLKNEYHKKHNLVHFLKGFYDGQQVEILEAQESYRLRSFARANGLIELGEAAGMYQRGSSVRFYRFSF